MAPSLIIPEPIPLNIRAAGTPLVHAQRRLYAQRDQPQPPSGLSRYH